MTSQVKIQNNTNTNKKDHNYNFKEALNEYFKLKNTYQNELQNAVKRISLNKDLNRREKRAEFKSLKPKCINCKRPVGTLFSSKFEVEKDTRVLSAVCGDIVNPCDLRIFINAGKGVESYLDIISDVEQTLQVEKNQLIQDKNDLLFGYITTEEALNKFEILKKDISDLTNSYSFHLEELNDITDNKKKREILNKNQETAYQLIDEIKEAIAKFNETGNQQWVNDAIEIDVNQLQPLLKKIRDSKYSSNLVELEESTYYLVQEKFTLQDIESALVLPEVIEFHLGSGNRGANRTRKFKESNPNPNGRTRKNRPNNESVELVEPVIDFDEEDDDVEDD